MNGPGAVASLGLFLWSSQAELVSLLLRSEAGTKPLEVCSHHQEL